ncbi:hypothetical protein GQE99_16665 [Maritimibacter sp. DP07]|uniref:Lipoprotein n=1 Tax=Maritimibacter harenae TaxID=2606218 RepID=A0A845MB16_9RHOB|nr:hypothetical protein [Maritimibacter harenae]MZR14654.1 hypothetical protein [Maritimibacter harenae]
MKKFVTLVLCLALSACAAGETRPVNAKAVNASSKPAEIAIREHSTLFDPNSAQFRKQKVYVTSEGDRVYCGELNSKNRMGGYVGFTPYYVRLNARGQLISTEYANTINIGYSAASACKEAAEGQLNVNI